VSVRTELEELVKWISGLSAEKPKAKSEPLAREVWQDVRGDLQDAAETLAAAQAALVGADERSALANRARVLELDARNEALYPAARRIAQARAALLAENPHSVLAELTLDLRNEADALARRAHLLSRRARPKPKAEPKPKPETKPKAEPKPKAAQAGAAEMASKVVEIPKTPAELVKTAADTIERAHRKLSPEEEAEDATGPVKELDAVAKRFEEELEVLGEMALSLRHRVERLHGEKSGAGR
jgi:hypothetical protein